ncbi:MAG: hypothetical protein ACXVB9_04425 [Bdellovibrionota bacterium]
MKYFWILLLLAGCSRQKTKADCIDICRAHGLHFVEVVPATKPYDPIERKERVENVCRCR